MTETFIALLFAHVLADFVFQTKRMVAAKDHAWGLLAHGAVVLATASAALGFTATEAVFALTIAHILIDWTKRAFGDGLWPYLADQAAHIASIAAVAAFWPGLWAAGAWAIFENLPQAFALLSGALIATRAGDFAVARVMAAFPELKLQDDTPGAGRAIGNLERLLAYAFMLLNQPAAIAILVGAKSILRFGSVGADRRASEYVLIGTLASIAWAILTALAIRALLAL